MSSIDRLDFNNDFNNHAGLPKRTSKNGYESTPENTVKESGTILAIECRATILGGQDDLIDGYKQRNQYLILPTFLIQFAKVRT